MIGLGNVTVRIDATVDGLIRSLSSAEKQLNRSARNMQRTANDLITSVSLPLIALGGAALNARGGMEQLEFGLISMMGSAEAANAELEKLAEAAKAPGINLEGLTRGSLQLQAVGFNAEDARRNLVAFGNALALSGGSAAELDGVALALTQIAAADQLLTQDVRQLTSRIPQLAGIFKETFGTSIPEEIAKGLAAAGKTNADFIEIVVSELEKLPPATSGISNSFENLGIAVNQSLGKIGRSLEQNFDITGKVAALTNIIEGAADAFTRLPAGVQATILTFLGLAAAIGPVLKLYAGLISLQALAVTRFKALIVSVKNQIVAFKALSATAQGVRLALLGIAGVALIAATVAYNNYRDAVERAGQAQKNVETAIRSATASVAGQEARVAALTKVINDSTASDQAKAAALGELKDISPDYYSTLDLAKGKVEGLTNATRRYIESLRLRAKAESLVNLISQQQDIQANLTVDTSFGNVLQTGLENLLGSPATLGARVATDLATEYTQQIKIAEDTIKGAKSELEIVQKELIELGKASPIARTSDAANDEIAKIIAAYERARASAVEFGKVYGESFNVVEAQSQAAFRAIDQLVEAGVKAGSPFIARIKSDLEALRQTPNVIEFIPNTTAIQSVSSNLPQVDLLVNLEIANPRAELVAGVFDQLKSSIAQAEISASVFGDQFDDVTAKISATKTAIQDLIRGGLNEFSPEVQKLVADLKGFQDIDLATQKINQFSEAVAKLVAQGFSDLFSDVAASFGEMLAGVSTSADLSRVIVSGLADIIIQVGRLIVSTGLSVEALATSLKTFSGVGAIIAGGALIALGSIVKAQLAKKATPFADGGIVSGPTFGLIGEYAGARNNPEVVAPLDKLRNILGDTGGANGFVAETKVRGEDIVIAIRRAEARMARRGY